MITPPSQPDYGDMELRVYLCTVQCNTGVLESLARMCVCVCVCSGQCTNDRYCEKGRSIYSERVYGVQTSTYGIPMVLSTSRLCIIPSIYGYPPERRCRSESKSEYLIRPPLEETILYIAPSQVGTQTVV